VNSKIHSVTKVFPFISNYRRELRIGVDIPKKKKVEKTMEFVKRMKNNQEKAGVVLKRI